MKPEHSPIGASSMYRWAVCPGSIRESVGKEQAESIYAKEGTEAHKYAAEWLKELFTLGKLSRKEKGEMYDAVAVYVQWVWNNFRSEDGDVLLVEHGFDLSAIYPGCYGKADVVIWKPKARRLIVGDFKYGAGILVSVLDNLQMQYYALGAMVDTKYPAEIVEMVIIQPRFEGVDPIRSQVIDAIDLYDFATDLQRFAKATEDPNAPLVPGEHCRFCPAAPTCPELHNQTTEIAKLEFSSALSYDPMKLKKALDMKPAIQAWLKNLDEFAYREAEAGRCAPGYKLVEKRPRREWIDEEAVRKELKSLGIKVNQIMTEPELKSPAQLEKIIAPSKIAHLIKSESSGHALVPEDDKRPAVKPSAKEEFKYQITMDGTDGSK